MQHWNGHKIHEHGIAAYFQMDTPRSLWIDRLKGLKSDGYSLDNLMWADRLKAPKNWDVTIPSHADWLEEHIQKLAPKIVFLDTFREMYNGDENDSTTVKKVVQRLVEACSGSAIVFISHARKSTQRSNYYNHNNNEQDEDDDEDITDGNRGSGYLAGRMDSIIKLTQKKILVKTRAGDTKMRYLQDQVGMLERKVEGDIELDTLVETVCMGFKGAPIEQHTQTVIDIAGMPEKSAYKVRQWHRNWQERQS